MIKQRTKGFLSIFSSVALFSFLSSLLSPQLQATISVELTPSLSSPQPVGTKVTWTASAVDSNPGPVTYKFEYAPPRSSDFWLLRDFSLVSTFDWVPAVSEGVYQIRVTARDYLAGETAQQTASFRVNSLVVNNEAVVTPTAHPLVALFSAPKCPPGSFMRVAYRKGGTALVEYTSFSPCGVASMNFYIAGLYPNSFYAMNYQVLTGTSFTAGPAVLVFQTGDLPGSVTLPVTTVPVPPASETAAGYRYVLTAFPVPGPVATDLNGEIVWYYLLEGNGGQLARPVAGGTFLMNLAGQGTGTGPWGTGDRAVRQQVLREFDLAGNLRRETNADRISEQLVAMGTEPIGRFNHDAIRLPNGYTIALGDVQRIYPAGTQGSTAPIDIIGEMIMVLDPNWQVVWYWNALDHAGGGTELDINRAPLRGEMCSVGPSGTTQNGCPPVLLSSPASDWLHANSIQLLADGNLLMSIRNQDWVIKIDYGNGLGTGDVLWRMGVDGDFTIISADPYPWFSGQHEAAFEDGGLQRMSVFDNGNSRVKQFGGNSRGQVLNVDEANRTVTLELNADLAVYSSSQGSAQPLPNGNWVFQPGSVNPGASVFEQCVEVTPAGSIVYTIQGSALSYRNWRMPSLYRPPPT